MAKCIAFDMKEKAATHRHINYTIVCDYGDYAYGHNLHTWDNGKRLLAKCKICGGYILIQKSEFHSFSDSGDSYYTDYFPVESEEEAERFNRLYDGFELETAFAGKYLTQDF